MNTSVILTLLFTLWTGFQCNTMAADTNAPDVSSFNGKTVAEFLKAFSLNLKSGTLCDEPPAQLRWIIFRNCPELKGHTVTLTLKPSGGLYSESRNWSETAIKQAAISEVMARDVIRDGPPKQKFIARLTTNQIGLVSVGVLDTPDIPEQQAVVRFFASNGIPSFIEGTVTFDVLVRTNDVERVHDILKTNRPAIARFRSAWENR